jgi:hypothetical protein
MEGKRNWWVVRKHLLIAADGKVAKGEGLRSRIFIPEPFVLERKEEIARRRQTIFGSLGRAEKGTHQLMIMIGEVKEIGRGKTGGRLLVKHMPDAPFYMNEALYGRAIRKFAKEIELWNAVESSHLLAVAAFGVSAAGAANIEELCLVNVDERWLPFEDINEKNLIDVAVAQKRRFVKNLRYNTADSVLLPSLVLVDLAESVALYVIPTHTAEETMREIADRAEGIASWHWDVSLPMPELPKKAN